MLSFVTAEEDLRIETSCPLNEATAVFMLKNLCYHHTSHSDEPLSYHDKHVGGKCMNEVCSYAMLMILNVVMPL